MATAITTNGKKKKDEPARPEAGAAEQSEDIIMRALRFDPYMYQIGTGPGVQKQGLLDFPTIRHMFHQCAALSAIRNTRLSQIASFAQRSRPEEKSVPGWKICLKEEEKQPTESDKNRIAEVERFFENLYRPNLPADIEQRVQPVVDYPEYGFEGFLRAVANDSIEIDALCFEKVRTRDGRLFTVWPVDGATIHRFLPYRRPYADPEKEPIAIRDVLGDSLHWLDERDKTRLSEVAHYAQVWQGISHAYFGRDDLCYRYRNVRTDVRYAGFGYPEAEQLVSVVTALLNAENYNSRNFSNGHIPEGLLHLIGSYDKGDLDAMRRDFEANAMGVWNAHRMAILVSRAEKAVASWIAFRMSNRDMEYGSFVKLLFDLAHAVFQISPQETGLGEGFGQPAPLSEHNPTAEIEHSEDKGLLPLLRFLAKVLTVEIVAEFYDDLEFRFVGTSQEDERLKLDQMQTRLQSGYSLPDEERAKNDDEPLPDGLGKIPVNPMLFQVWQAREQQKQQEKMAGEPPPEGSPDRLNYFRAPGQEDQQGDGQQEQDQDASAPEAQEEQQAQLEKAHSAAIEYARSLVLSGCNSEYSK